MRGQCPLSRFSLAAQGDDMEGVSTTGSFLAGRMQSIEISSRGPTYDDRKPLSPCSDGIKRPFPSRCFFTRASRPHPSAGTAAHSPARAAAHSSTGTTSHSCAGAAAHPSGGAARAIHLHGRRLRFNDLLIGKKLG